MRSGQFSISYSVWHETRRRFIANASQFCCRGYAIKETQECRMCERLQLNGAHELLVCFADINLLGENVRTVQTTQTLDQSLIRRLIWQYIARKLNSLCSYVVNRLQDKFETQRELINPSKTWRSSNIWNDINQNCMHKKLRAGEVHGEFPNIRTRIFFCLPVCFLKANVLKNSELLYCVFLCMSVKTGLSH